MTDEQIIKALECCADDSVIRCKECLYGVSIFSCRQMQLKKDSLDLINRQKAEIEILKKNPHRFVLTDDESFESLVEKVKKLNPLVMSPDNVSIVCIDADKIKAEAIKEFAERLKVKSYPFPCAIGVENAVTIRAINDLVKEMAGENNESC